MEYFHSISRSSHAILTTVGDASYLISLFPFQLQSLDHNINFSLESLIKRDMKEIKGVSKADGAVGLVLSTEQRSASFKAVLLLEFYTCLR